jgi:hypothetical protein
LCYPADPIVTLHGAREESISQSVKLAAIVLLIKGKCDENSYFIQETVYTFIVGPPVYFSLGDPSPASGFLTGFFTGFFSRTGCPSVLDL